MSINGKSISNKDVGHALEWLFLRLLATGALLSVPLLCVVWYGFLIAPFTNFTFTDAPDFIFAGLINVSITLVVWRHVKKPYPERWIKFASASAFVFAILAPLIPLIALYALSFRAEALIGHWPHVMINDPKWIGKDDAIWGLLLHVNCKAEAFAGWGLFTWAALMLHLRRSLTTKQLIWHVVIFVAAWMIFLYEPGGRFWWWMD